jgi:hypothetical protein
MDIAGTSIALNQAKIMQAASLSVMKLAMNTAKTSGEMLSQLMNQNLVSPVQSAEPHLGQHIDIRG